MSLAPTPWTVDLASEDKEWTSSISIADANGGHIAHLTRGYEADSDGDGCPSWANARLIAAAPDLLARAREVDRWALVIESAVRASCGSGSRDYVAVVAALKKNADAIKKASVGADSQKVAGYDM